MSNEKKDGRLIYEERIKHASHQIYGNSSIYCQTTSTVLISFLHLDSFCLDGDK